MIQYPIRPVIWPVITDPAISQSRVTGAGIGATSSDVLLESGSHLLLEDGSYLLLE